MRGPYNLEAYCGVTVDAIKSQEQFSKLSGSDVFVILSDIQTKETITVLITDPSDPKSQLDDKAMVIQDAYLVENETEK